MTLFITILVIVEDKKILRKWFKFNGTALSLCSEQVFSSIIWEKQSERHHHHCCMVSFFIIVLWMSLLSEKNVTQSQIQHRHHNSISKKNCFSLSFFFNMSLLIQFFSSNNNYLPNRDRLFFQIPFFQYFFEKALLFKKEKICLLFIWMVNCPKTL